MKLPTAPERLASAITSLLIRVHNYCKAAAESPVRIGLCIVNQKHAPHRQISEEICKELMQMARDHFMSINVPEFYFHLWSPPILPIVEGINSQALLSLDDFQLTYQIPIHTLAEEQRTMARSFISCEINHWWNVWFEIEDEAIRYVPQVYQEIKEETIVRKIRIALAQNGQPVFTAFANDFTIRSEHLGISVDHKNQIKSGKETWKTYHKGIQDLFNSAKTLFDFYEIAKEKAKHSRNDAYKLLLTDFVEYVENTLIKKADLPEDLKRDFLNKLRGIDQKQWKNSYQAKRPACCISDVECGQTLYLLLQKFLENPKKYSVYAEMALFIWICQQAAFDNVSIKEKDILNIKVTDVDISGLEIQINNRPVQITQGLADLIKAWIGDKYRQNKRSLFPSLTYDNLAEKIKKITQQFYSEENFLLPHDFLMKAHAIPFARLSASQRAEINYQAELIKDSPYRIRNKEIEKHIPVAHGKRYSKIRCCKIFT